LIGSKPLIVNQFRGSDCLIRCRIVFVKDFCFPRYDNILKASVIMAMGAGVLPVLNI